jgi:hypothetical protein
MKLNEIGRLRCDSLTICMVWCNSGGQWCCLMSPDMLSGHMLGHDVGDSGRVRRRCVQMLMWDIGYVYWGFQFQSPSSSSPVTVYEDFPWREDLFGYEIWWNVKMCEGEILLKRMVLFWTVWCGDDVDVGIFVYEVKIKNKNYFYIEICRLRWKKFWGIL